MNTSYKHLLIHIEDTNITQKARDDGMRRVKYLNHYDEERRVEKYSDINDIVSLPEFNDFTFLTVLHYSNNRYRNRIGHYKYIDSDKRRGHEALYFYNAKHINSKFSLEDATDFETRYIDDGTDYENRDFDYDIDIGVDVDVDMRHNLRYSMDSGKCSASSSSSSCCDSDDDICVPRDINDCGNLCPINNTSCRYSGNLPADADADKATLVNKVCPDSNNDNKVQCTASSLNNLRCSSSSSSCGDSSDDDSCCQKNLRSSSSSFDSSDDDSCKFTRDVRNRTCNARGSMCLMDKRQQLPNNEIRLKIFKNIKTPALFISLINMNAPIIKKLTENYILTDTGINIFSGYMDSYNYSVYVINELPTKTKPALH